MLTLVEQPFEKIREGSEAQTRFYDYLLAIREPTGFVKYQDFNIDHIRDLAHEVAVIEVGSGVTTVQYYGLSLQQRMGVKPIGCDLLDLLTSELRAYVLRILTDVVQFPCLAYNVSENRYDNNAVGTIHGTMYPMMNSISGERFVVGLWHDVSNLMFRDDELKTIHHQKLLDSGLVDIGFGTEAKNDMADLVQSGTVISR